MNSKVLSQLKRFVTRKRRPETDAPPGDLECIRLEDRILFSASPLGMALDVDPSETLDDLGGNLCESLSPTTENESFSLSVPSLLVSNAIHVNAVSDHDLHDHDFDGRVFEGLIESEADASLEATTGASAAGDLSDTFSLVSNPGADQTIFLDFDGHTTSGSTWNGAYFGGADFYSNPYDKDGDVTSFSDLELQAIQDIWTRVAEDFIGFDVNVTTVDPGADALIKSDDFDPMWGIRAVITDDTSDWYGSNVSGLGIPGSFNSASDTPVFIFSSQLANGNDQYVATTASHEIGHSMGLSHDGTSTSTYYGGHGFGDTGWSSIMGGGLNKKLSQWSQGEYADATNQQDDLAIITTNNGFDYRIDDHGSDFDTASFLTFHETGVSANGIIERNTDVDVFSFATSGGIVDLQIDGIERGSNLDILAELFDADNNLILSSNPVDQLDADIQTTVAGGIYYLTVTGTGKGDPLVDGYTDYGSLGQYFISGSIDAAPGTFLDIIDTSAIVTEGDEASTEMVFTVRRSGDLSAAATVDFSVRGTGNNAADHSDFAGGVAPAGTVSFAAGESSKTISVYVAGDVVAETDEFLTVTISNPGVNAVITTAQAEGVILNDDVPEISKLAGIHVTPDTGLTTNESGATASFSVMLDSQPTADVVIHVASTDLSEGVTSVDTLRFTNTNWNHSQVVTVVGRDDAEFDGDVSYTIEVSAAQSDDADYNGLDADDVIVVNHDNESQPKVKGKGKGGGSSGGDGDGGGKGNGNGKDKGGKNADVQEMLLLSDGDLFESTENGDQTDDVTPRRRTAAMPEFLPERAREAITGNEGKLFQRLFAASLARMDDEVGEDEAGSGLGVGSEWNDVTVVPVVPSLRGG